MSQMSYFDNSVYHLEGQIPPMIFELPDTSSVKKVGGPSGSFLIDIDTFIRKPSVKNVAKSWIGKSFYIYVSFPHTSSHINIYYLGTCFYVKDPIKDPVQKCFQLYECMYSTINLIPKMYSKKSSWT